VFGVRRSMSRSRDDFLRHFLANEGALRRTILALVPNLADADDILQQTAVALWEEFDRFDPSRDFRPWACQFARHRALRWIDRRKRWNRFLDRSLAERIEETRGTMAEGLDERLDLLGECVEELPSASREVVRHYYYDRRNIEEIARQHRKSPAAVYKILQRVRAALRECIERKQQARFLE